MWCVCVCVWCGVWCVFGVWIAVSKTTSWHNSCRQYIMCTLKDTVHSRSLCMQGSQGDKQCWFTQPCEIVEGGDKYHKNSLPLVLRDAVNTPHHAYLVLTYRNMRCHQKQSNNLCHNFFLRRRDHYNVTRPRNPATPTQQTRMNEWMNEWMNEF